MVSNPISLIYVSICYPVQLLHFFSFESVQMIQTNKCYEIIFLLTEKED
jgi:hypothetical protein